MWDSDRQHKHIKRQKDQEIGNAGKLQPPVIQRSATIRLKMETNAKWFFALKTRGPCCYGHHHLSTSFSSVVTLSSARFFILVTSNGLSLSPSHARSVCHTFTYCSFLRQEVREDTAGTLWQSRDLSLYERKCFLILLLQRGRVHLLFVWFYSTCRGNENDCLIWSRKDEQ